MLNFLGKKPPVADHPNSLIAALGIIFLLMALIIVIGIISSDQRTIDELYKTNEVLQQQLDEYRAKSPQDFLEEVNP